MACVSGEVAYNEVTSDVPITATGFEMTEITRVTVPALPYPVYVEWELWAVADSNVVSSSNPINTKALAGVVPAAALGPTALFDAFGVDRVGRGSAGVVTTGITDADRYIMGLMTEFQNGLHKMGARSRLGPNRPGEYVLAGSCTEGATRLWHVKADSTYVASLSVMRGR